MINKISQIEKSLQENRELLNQIIQESKINDSEILKEKIRVLQQDINSLNLQLNEVRKQVFGTQISVESKVIQNPINKIIQKPKEEVTSIYKPPKKSFDFEKTIGKNLMPIFASTLIFIALIFFATLLVPYLTEEIKIGLMYLFSITLTGISLFLYEKKKNKFFIGLTSCGIGALYISILVSNIYFKIINDIVLYICIFIWAIFVCILSRNRTKVFQIIGYIGIFISICFGSAICTQKGLVLDVDRFFILLIFFIITSSIFFFSSFNKAYKKNLIGLIFNMITIFPLFITFSITGGELVGINLLFVLYFIAYILLLNLFKYNKEGLNIVAIINIVFYLIFTFICFANLIENDTLFFVTCLCVTILLYSLKELKLTKEKLLDYSLSIFYVVLSIIFVIQLDKVSFIIFALLFIGLNYLKEDKIKVLTFMTYFICFLIRGPIFNSFIYFVIGAGTLFAYIISSLLRQEIYNTKYKNISCILFYILLRRFFASLDIDFEFTYFFIVACFCNFVYWKCFLSKDFRTKEEESSSTNLFRIINAILMSIGISQIFSLDDSFLLFVVIIVTCFIFSFNVANILKQYDSYFPGFYVGFKYTVLLISILNQLTSISLIFSISLIILAIISIILGFKFEFKSLRIYGLILSMFSIAKLIMIDVSYDNLIQRAFGFLVCGILCFGINLIYNKIDKNLKK